MRKIGKIIGLGLPAMAVLLFGAAGSSADDYLTNSRTLLTGIEIAPYDVQVRLPLSVDFAYKSDDLQPDEADKLLPLIPVLRSLGEPFTVVLEAYSDPVGTPIFNARLARSRAESVRDYLIGEVDVPVDIVARGEVESTLAAINGISRFVGPPLNSPRRVDVSVVKHRPPETQIDGAPQPPEVLDFSGRPPVVFPADRRLDLASGGVVEFWMRPAKAEAVASDIDWKRIAAVVKAAYDEPAGTEEASARERGAAEAENGSQGRSPPRGTDADAPQSGPSPQIVTIADLVPDQSFQTLLAARAGASVRYAVFLGSDNRTLAVWDGAATRWQTWEVDFDEGNWHHVALVTVGRKTFLYADGVALGGRPIGYGNTPVLALVVGGFNAEQMAYGGEIGRIRIWNGVLMPDEVTQLPGLKQPPKASDPTFAALAGHSLYVESREHVAFSLLDAFHRPKGRWKAFGADFVQRLPDPTQSAVRDAIVSGSKADEYRRQARARLSGRVHNPASDAVVKEMLAETAKLADIDQLSTFGFTTFANYTLQWQGDPARRPLDISVDAASAAAAASGRRGVHESGVELPEEQVIRGVCLISGADGDVDGFALLTGDKPDQTTGLRVSAWAGPLDPRVRRNPARLDTLCGSGDASSIANLRAIAPIAPKRVLFSGGEVLRSITGYREAGRLTGLRFNTNKRLNAADGPQRIAGLAWKPEAAFTLTLPAGGVLSTVGYRYGDDTGLEALTLLLSDGSRRPGLVVHYENGAATRFEQIARNVYRSLTPYPPIAPDERNPILRFETERRFTIADTDFVPVAPAPELEAGGTAGETALKDRDAFDNTFVIEATAVNLRANYSGYNYVEMDPLHLVDNGVGKNIFAIPQGRSRDYYGVNHIFVPNGLIYLPDFSGQQHAETHEIKSLNNYKTQLSTTVGASVAASGTPAAFSFSRTVSHAREALKEHNHSLTLGLSRISFYDLVINKPQMRLDADFEAVVRRTAARLFDPETGAERLSGDERAQLLDRLIETFGTHYAYGVTYGGMGVLQIAYNAEMRGKLKRDGVDIKVQAGKELSQKAKGGPPISGQLNFSQSRSHEQSFEDTVGDQTNNFYWVGGSHAGFEQGSWSVGQDGVVPIRVDLRQLDELIAPPFFHEPLLVDRFRFVLKDAIADYISRFREGDVKVDEQPIVEVKVDSIECLWPGDEWDGDVEFLGQVSVVDTAQLENLSGSSVVGSWGWRPELTDRKDTDNVEGEYDLTDGDYIVKPCRKNPDFTYGENNEGQTVAFLGPASGAPGSGDAKLGLRFEWREIDNNAIGANPDEAERKTRTLDLDDLLGRAAGLGATSAKAAVLKDVLPVVQCSEPKLNRTCSKHFDLQSNLLDPLDQLAELIGDTETTRSLLADPANRLRQHIPTGPLHDHLIGDPDLLARALKSERAFFDAFGNTAILLNAMVEKDPGLTTLSSGNFDSWYDCQAQCTGFAAHFTVSVTP